MRVSRTQFIVVEGNQIKSKHHTLEYAVKYQQEECPEAHIYAITKCSGEDEPVFEQSLHTRDIVGWERLYEHGKPGRRTNIRQRKKLPDLVFAGK